MKKILSFFAAIILAAGLAAQTSSQISPGGSGSVPAGGTTSQVLAKNSNADFDIGWAAAGTGTVTTVSVTTANGVSGTVATATTTPAITLTLGAITPTTVNGNTLTTGTYTLTGTAAKTLNFTNTLTLSGTDSTTMTFPAASATMAGLGTTQTFTGINTLTPAARSSGTANYFTVNIPADTGITTATEAIGYQHVTATRTWVDGTVALQRENFFAGPTYNKTTTSATFTDVFNTYFTPPIAGSGVTFTRGHSLGIVDSTSAASSITGGFVVATTLGTSATSVGIGGGNVNAGGLVTGGTITSTGLFTASSTSTFTGATTHNNAVTINGAAATTALTITNTARTSGVLPYIKWTIPTDTSQTTATESPGLVTVTGTRTWAAGTVPSQRENLFVPPTYAQSSAGTFTEAATFAIGGAPISGTNSSITTDDAVLIQAVSSTAGAGTAPVTTNSLKILNQTGGSSHNYALQAGTSGTGITNIRHGITGNLSAGTLTVSDAGATANTRYFFTAHTLGTVTVTSSYYASSRSAGVSFTVTASIATDTSTLDWMAIEP